MKLLDFIFEYSPVNITHVLIYVSPLDIPQPIALNLYILLLLYTNLTILSSFNIASISSFFSKKLFSHLDFHL